MRYVHVDAVPRFSFALSALFLQDFVVTELMRGASLSLRLKHMARAGQNAWPWFNRLCVLRDVAVGMAEMHAKRPSTFLQSPCLY